MKPSRLVTSGGVRRHTGRGMKKITKAALVGGAAAAAIAATVGMAAPANANAERLPDAGHGFDSVILGLPGRSAWRTDRSSLHAGAVELLVGRYVAGCDQRSRRCTRLSRAARPTNAVRTATGVIVLASPTREGSRPGNAVRLSAASVPTPSWVTPTGSAARCTSTGGCRILRQRLCR